MVVKSTGPYCHSVVLQWEEGGEDYWQPHPYTVTWLFNRRKVENDYSTELGKDGSLVLVSVEMKHAGTYAFTVSNSVGSVEGCTKLVVHWFV